MTPRPEFAGPAIEALRFAGHNEPLRDLYANLLATAMDADTARYAHPAFVEIVKQLSPDEAKLLVEASRLPVNELAFVTLSASVTGSTGKSIVLHRFVTLGERAGCAFPDLTSSYLNNLERLGLLEIDDTAHWVGEQADVIFKSLEDHPQGAGVASEHRVARGPNGDDLTRPHAHHRAGSPVHLGHRCRPASDKRSEISGRWLGRSRRGRG